MASTVRLTRTRTGYTTPGYVITRRTADDGYITYRIAGPNACAEVAYLREAREHIATHRETGYWRRLTSTLPRSPLASR